MDKNLCFIVGGLFLLFFVAFFLYQPNSAIENNFDLNSKQKTEEIPPQRQLVQQDLAEQQLLIHPSIEDVDVKQIQQYQTEIVDWEKHHFGKFPDEGEYGYYDNEILEGLADQNDILALQILAQRHASYLEFDKAANYYYKAAILGSTYALDLLGLYKESVGGLSEPDKIKKKLIYYQTAFLMGDKSAVAYGVRLLQNNDLELTKEEIDSIHQKALTFYNQLLVERKNIGLGGFDPVPTYVKEYQNLLYGRYNQYTTGPDAIFLTTPPEM